MKSLTNRNVSRAGGLTAAILLLMLNCQMTTGLIAQTVTKIAAGGYHSLFIKSDGSLWGMGYNVVGQLGRDPYSLFQTNIPFAILSGGVTAMAAGGYHSLFIESDGSLWVMGWNGGGQLGDGSSAYEHDSPERIVTNGVTAVAGGDAHSLFITHSGKLVTLWAAGTNTYGQLGSGSTISTNSPEVINSSIPALGPFVNAIAAGYAHSLYVKTDGSLWGMGWNIDGSLGIGTAAEQNSPVEIETGNVIAVAAGDFHSLFLKSNGSLWGMGENDHGELGDGTSSARFVPVPIVASGVVAVAAGADHSLFIKSDGSLWGMGWNANGQLGLGSTNDQHLPVPIVASNVVAVSAGIRHSLFIKSDGSLWAMGGNAFGQLGDGTTNDSHIPIQIVPFAVRNGGFESADFEGWLASSTFWQSLVSSKPAYVHSGAYGAQLGPVGALGYLYQNFVTTAGANYRLSLWLNSPDGATPNEFKISWNGISIFDVTNLPAMGWTNLQFRVAATGLNSLLQFGIRNDDSYFGLDDVSVVLDEQPVITGILLAGTNLVLNASNGISGDTYLARMSTVLTLPFNQWAPVATNMLTAGGDFTIIATNAVNVASPQRFFILERQN